MGIFGIVGNEGEDIAEQACLQGLKELGTLPYDACGIASLRTPAEGKSNLVITKHAQEYRYGGDCLRKLAASAANMHRGSIGIAHTRWATHGGKTDSNAHPHTDHKNRIALVHNGIIENY